MQSLGGLNGDTIGRKQPAIKPRGVMCYLCGKEYGTTSIDIHLKTCKRKWEEEEAKKPKNKRRPLPEAPQAFDKLKTGSGMDYG